MKIRVTQCPDREEATVEVVDPGGDGTPETVFSCTELCNGNTVELDVPMAGSPDDIIVGEPTKAEESPVKPVGDGEQFEEQS